MANLQVKNVPDDLHDRLRRLAQGNGTTISGIVLRAVERELTRLEWKERRKDRPKTDLGVPAAELLAKARAEFDAEIERRLSEATWLEPVSHDAQSSPDAEPKSGQSARETDAVLDEKPRAAARLEG